MIPLEILEECLLGLIGEKPKGQLTQRGEVVGARAIVECLWNLLGWVDVAMQHPAAELIGRGVDELDLVRLAHDPVRHSFTNLSISDALDDILNALEVLDIDGCNDIDPRIEQFDHVLPAFLRSRRSRHIGVGKLVDQHDLWVSGKYAIEVHLFKHSSSMLNHPAGNDLKISEARLGHGPTVAFVEADDDVRAAVAAAMAFVEHRDGLSDPGRCAEIDAKAASAFHQVLGGSDIAHGSHIRSVKRCAHVKSLGIKDLIRAIRDVR
jgi:hypothetical protein